MPFRVGVVTSSSGAALRDILQILKKGSPCVDILIRSARVQGDTAAWDGVRRRVALTGGPVMGSDLMLASQGVRGEIAAASLHVAVLSPDGELRFEGAGGLSLLQQIDEQEKARGTAQVAVELRPDAFADASELREGVEAAFRRPLPASRAH